MPRTCFLIQRPQDLSVIEGPFRDLEPEMPRDKGLGPPFKIVVELGPVLPANGENILKSFRKNKGRPDSLVFQKGIGGHGRPVDEGGDLIRFDSHLGNDLLDPVDDPDCRIGRGGRGFGNVKGLLLVVEQDHIGECSP